jgi:hypothetical protein
MKFWLYDQDGAQIARALMNIIEHCLILLQPAVSAERNCPDGEDPMREEPMVCQEFQKRERLQQASVAPIESQWLKPIEYRRHRSGVVKIVALVRRGPRRFSPSNALDDCVDSLDAQISAGTISAE